MIVLWVEPLAILAFIVLLFSAIFMVLQFYVCDSENCKAFTDADEVAPRGSKDYTIALLNNLYNDGIWALPYIGAVIITILTLWLIGVPITVKTFAIVFLISFIVIYFLFSFFGHHYIKFIATYVAEYIDNECPGVNTNVNTIEDNKQNNNEENNDEESSDNEINGGQSNIELLNITFAPPSNTF